MAPGYTPLPTDDCERQRNPESILRNKRRDTVKKTIFYLLAVVAVMFTLVHAAKGISAVCRMASGRMHMKNGTHVHGGCHHMKGMGCHGTNRTISSTPGLPTFYTLPSGDKIPSVALGVWRANPGQVGEAVKTALKVGYRHIDGAWIYGNEVEVGKAIRESGVSRRDIWLTSKLWNTFHDPQDVEPALDESLSRLGTEYLDLYLIHWPVAFKKGGDKNEIDWDLTENPYPTWQKLEEMVEKGKVRNIGVSNFNIRRFQNLTANPLKIKPAINQVELSYWNPQPELLKWSKENGLLLEAYSPLGSQDKVKETLQLPLVKAIAEELDMTPAQVVISWQLQRGVVVLPKSVTPSRVMENLHVTRLPQDTFDKLEQAARSHKPERSVDPNWGVDVWN